MGLFSKAKENETGYTYDKRLNNTQKEFLNLTDEAMYMSFRQKDMRYLAKHVTRSLYINVYNMLIYDRPEAAVSTDFRHTSFTLVSSDSLDCKFTVRKKVIFDKVKVSKQLKLPIAEDYEELWHIEKQGDSLVLSAITEVKYV